ncbi:dimethylhistidine N-methyltransferase [Terrihabitans soli]|uniref:Dimethylhistidine N-methyltransferase n=1 Tax=Terrihabitans soli TaxID=708113 RepID=A0A6S6QP63_9HYPH|nr:L-histidine N(alpha)-methyltransferase [Terrihabitans soli]BCJ92354.1 dimethylhistidine N-methyltransferase [Terrihabitans soli]
MTPALAAALHLDDDLNPLIRDEFLRDVLNGLSQRQKTIPPKYFYDAAGSRLFDRICDLPEYYPTRTETKILRESAQDIAARAGWDVALIEFGSGSSTKVRILLDALRLPAAYVPIDICGPHLEDAAAALRRDYPQLAVTAIHADFTQEVQLPDSIRGKKRLGFFPGSTIGNFTPPEAEAFLSKAAKTLGAGADMLVGVDLKKHGAVLHAAYNDHAGVTAAFNLNLLTRINRELRGDFDLSAFRHRAVYNAAFGRIEMYLESLKPQIVHIAGDVFAFREGETIHTENSYKYTIESFHRLVKKTGWKIREVYVDREKLFSVHFLSR